MWCWYENPNRGPETANENIQAPKIDIDFSWGTINKLSINWYDFTNDAKIVKMRCGSQKIYIGELMIIEWSSLNLIDRKNNIKVFIWDQLPKELITKLWFTNFKLLENYNNNKIDVKQNNKYLRDFIRENYTSLELFEQNQQMYNAIFDKAQQDNLFNTDFIKAYKLYQKDNYSNNIDANNVELDITNWVRIINVYMPNGERFNSTFWDTYTSTKLLYKAENLSPVEIADSCIYSAQYYINNWEIETAKDFIRIAKELNPSEIGYKIQQEIKKLEKKLY